MNDKKSRFNQYKNGVYQIKPSGITEVKTYCEQCKKELLDHRSLVQHEQRGHK